MVKFVFLISLFLSAEIFAAAALVKNDEATVQQEPDFKSLVLFRLKKNTAVDISETSYYGWHTTTVKGKKGYIHVSNLILNYEGTKSVLEKSNPFDKPMKPRVDYYFDMGLVPAGIAGQQFFSGVNFAFGYEGESFERGITFGFGAGLGEYKIRSATFLLNFGWKFTRYTAIGITGGYEYLKFTDLSVQKSPKDGRAYRAAFDPRGYVVGGYFNQKIEGKKYSFVLNEVVMLETYSIDKISGSEIYYDNPVQETKDNVKPRLFMSLTMSVRFYL